LCNATSAGFGSGNTGCPIPDASFLHSELLVTDVIYNPETTPLLTMAEGAGCRTLNGLGMLLHQGAAAFQIWTGKEMPVDLVRQVLRQ